MDKIKFKIKNADDIYCAVGQIIQASQQWEQNYREYALRVGVEIEKHDIATLRRVNGALKEKGIISERDYNSLNRVIHLRNYVNHEFFIQDFHRDYEWIEEELSEILFYVYEAVDLVANMTEKLEGSSALRQTVFD